MLGFLQALERNMLDLDAPDHTRLRSLVHLAFTPCLVDRMRSRIERLSEELLARAIDRGHLDLIADYALPIPLTVISEMLGIPTADQLRFHRWSNTIVASSAAPNLIRVLPAVWRFVRYLRKVIAAKGPTGTRSDLGARAGRGGRRSRSPGSRSPRERWSTA